MHEDNDERQKDELEALAAIYGDDFLPEDTASGIYSVRLRGSDSVPNQEIILKVTLPKTYPGECPPIYEIQAPWLKGSDRLCVHDALEEIYFENVGEGILFQWTEKIREILSSKASEEDFEDNIASEIVPDFADQKESASSLGPSINECPSIFHGEPLVDRKSTFQAHVAKVRNINDINAVKGKLMQNKKVANATHNIVAYRFKNKNGAIAQDCDDDGETAAGSRLLHLLNILDCDDVLVIVSRWYGGIHLGPDRFKHINNVARVALENYGLLKQRALRK